MENGLQANINVSPSKDEGHGPVSIESLQSFTRLSSFGRIFGECYPPGFLKKVILVEYDD